MLVLSSSITDNFNDVLEMIPVSKRLLITSRKNWEKADQANVNKAFSQVHLVEEYRDSAEVELKALELFKSYGFSRIISSATGECDLLRAAQLREYLGLEGQDYKSALSFRDKKIMKDIVTEAGYNAPKYAEVNSGIDLIKFIDKHGYPVIIKPKRDAASIGTQLIEDVNDLGKVMKKRFNTRQYSNLMVETFVKGKMFHIDGLVLNGQVIAWPSIYTGTAMDMMEGKVYVDHLLSPENPLIDLMIDYAKKILAIFPTPRNTAFHFECFLDNKDELTFCEIASRVGGGYISWMWQTAFDINLRKAFYQIQAGLDVSKPLKLQRPKCIPGSIVLPKKRGLVKNIAYECPLDFVTNYSTFCIKGDMLEKSENTFSPVLSCFILGSSERDFLEKKDKFIDWLNSSFYIEEN
ncbi:MAG: hypothetical protein BGO76_00310 [Caedibacter sp. 38-128]|nr:ATP-grasp domain-containing protein [Holosporales bacterium]OJX05027.1 MAG: hypothetical protein BGO76_00310 [Caedibacter sp. 38-128]